MGLFCSHSGHQHVVWSLNSGVSLCAGQGGELCCWGQGREVGMQPSVNGCRQRWNKLGDRQAHAQSGGQLINRLQPPDDPKDLRQRLCNKPRQPLHPSAWCMRHAGHRGIQRRVNLESNGKNKSFSSWNTWDLRLLLQSLPGEMKVEGGKRYYRCLRDKWGHGKECFVCWFMFHERNFWSCL